MRGIRSEMDKTYLVAENEEMAKSVSGKIEWLASFGSTIHVDVPAWLRRLRIAPSRTSSISTIHHALVWFAAHNHPTRHALISAAQAGIFYLQIYLAVTSLQHYKYLELNIFRMI